MKKPTSCLAIALLFSSSVSQTFATDALSIDSEGNVAISEKLTVQDSTTLNGALTVDKATTINKTLTVSGKTTLNSKLDVADTASLAKTLHVGGAANLSGTLEVDGATTLKDTLAVTGATTLSKGLAVTGNLTTSGTTTLGNSATITDGTLTINGPQGNMVFTSMKSDAGKGALPWSSSIAFGDDVGIRYHKSQQKISPFPQKFTVESLVFYSPGGSDGFATITSLPKSTMLSSPREDTSLHLASNGKAVTVSNTGSPLEEPNSDAALHVDGKIAHQGLLKLSDRKAKKNIAPLNNSLERVVSIQGVGYNWKDTESDEDQKLEAGFIAQDIETIIPEAVSQDEHGTRYMDYEALIPYLVEAIKEQQAAIETQQATINLLTSKIAALE